MANRFNLDIFIDEDLIGGVSIDENKTPITDEVIAKAKSSDAIILGGVGGPKWDNLPSKDKPEKGLLRLRSDLKFFANLRPSICFSETSGASSLKKEIIEDLDLLIVRELTGGIYFGEPREKSTVSAFNTMIYSKDEIRRISEVSRLMIDAGVIVLTAFISPFEEERKLASTLVKAENFYLVHVECSVEKCEERDVKGLYKKARSGEIKNFTGIDSPYEIPQNPSLTVNTENESVEESVNKIFKGILQKIK